MESSLRGMLRTLRISIRHPSLFRSLSPSVFGHRCIPKTSSKTGSVDSCYLQILLGLRNSRWSERVMNSGYWDLTHWQQRKREDVTIHVHFLGEPVERDLHKLRLKTWICFQLVMACIQHEKYAPSEYPQRFQRAPIKNPKQERWLIRCWNHRARIREAAVASENSSE